MTASQIQYLSDQEWIILCNLVAHKIMHIQDMEYSDITRVYPHINWFLPPKKRAKQIEQVIKRIYK